MTTARDVARMLVLAAAYYASARLGLRFDALGGIASSVWPPTGLALAALLLGGRRLWPGLALGAFAVNVQPAGLVPAAGIAVGNTLEAVVGASLLARAGFRTSMERVQDVLALVALAGLLATTISATLGTASLWLSGAAVDRGYGWVWLVWWLGDALGALVVAPALLVWSRRARVSLTVPRAIEAFVLIALLIAVSAIIFFRVPPPAGTGLRPFLIFPLITWSGLRFGQRGVTATLAAVASLAVAGARMGLGPYVPVGGLDALLRLQLFNGVLAVTSLVLAAAVAERRLAVQVRDDFLSIASHELKTPMTALRLRVQGVRRTLRGGATPAGLEVALRTVEHQIDRLAQLVDELLDATRAAAGKLELDRGAVDLAELAREVVARDHEAVEAAGTPIALHVDGTVQGHWDRGRLQQVLDNLLSNALKYGDGSPVDVHVTKDGGTARLVVVDRGTGIPHEEQARIFERFERARGARHVRGLGLGLYIVRQIVEAHGGTVRVRSAVGQGATFTVELPLEPLNGLPRHRGLVPRLAGWGGRMRAAARHAHQSR